MRASALLALSALGLAAPALAIPTTVSLDYITMQGASSTTNGVDIVSFKGIPYAAPPTGSLRWKPPQAPQTYTGVFNATAYGDTCIMNMPSMGGAPPTGMAPPGGNGTFSGPPPGANGTGRPAGGPMASGSASSEDCLKINVGYLTISFSFCDLWLIFCCLRAPSGLGPGLGHQQVPPRRDGLHCASLLTNLEYLYHSNPCHFQSTEAASCSAQATQTARPSSPLVSRPLKTSSRSRSTTVSVSSDFSDTENCSRRVGAPTLVCKTRKPR